MKTQHEKNWKRGAKVAKDKLKRLFLKDLRCKISIKTDKDRETTNNCIFLLYIIIYILNKSITTIITTDI